MSIHVKPTNKLETKIVAWCNDIRKKYGKGKPRKTLKKGLPGSCSMCVLAMTSGVCMHTHGSFSDQPVVRRPKFVRAFELEFDRGRLPHLIDEALDALVFGTL